MTEWILTNTYDLASRRGKAVSPTNPHVMLSPYFVPEALRSYLKDENIVIEFRYINIDETHYVHQENVGVAFELGEKTGRIYKILIALSMIDHKNATEVIAQALDTAIRTFISRDNSKKIKTTKYSATLSSLKENADRIEESIHLQQAQ
ncbi:MAG: hypothetical protein R3271_12795 [Methylophaga sp.]|uniref:hypothetical protein n=1 Tax=Methylophaga sp. TaxID=2024840 RepID=UPI00299DA8DA|nr:hypothetical protein [Methylophaga sp.]MDX1751188.1 hypothetical protein [Methylophaga sp.]